MMAEGSDAGGARRVTDRDLARLVRQGREELAGDPRATELHERISDRENLEEDRDHRARSSSAAMMGFLAGLALLIILVAVSFVTFEP
ncbi:hypothetical protein [Streptomyces sp. NPDC058657]|uniref:hypothetical protein n=1 Tax=unclassified Streptomyces TaxID=2593676 RepID=UPI0036523324